MIKELAHQSVYGGGTKLAAIEFKGALESDTDRLDERRRGYIMKVKDLVESAQMVMKKIWLKFLVDSSKWVKRTELTTSAHV